MKISVVIPCRNEKAYITECVHATFYLPVKREDQLLLGNSWLSLGYSNIID